MLITQVDRLIDIMLFYDINIIGTYRYLGLSGSGLSFLYYRILGASESTACMQIIIFLHVPS